MSDTGDSPAAPLAGVRALAGLTALQRQVLLGYLEHVETARGETIVVESAPADRLFFVERGQLAVEHREAELAALGPGDHFGVEALLGGRAHPASVRTRGVCSLFMLGASRFEALGTEHPEVAQGLLRGLLGLTLAQARAARPAAGLPPQRAPADSVEIRVGGDLRQVPVGTTYGEVLPRHDGQRRVVAALVDEKATSLRARVSSGVSVRPLTLAHWEGQRIYRRSLALLALEAARSLEPRLSIKAGPSIGFGQRLLVPELSGLALARFAERLESEMLEISRSGATLREELWTVSEACQYFESQGFRDAAQLLATWQEHAVPLVTYGHVYALDTLPLLPDLQDLRPFHLMADEDILLLVYGSHAEAPAHPTRSLPVRALTDLGEAPPPRLRASVIAELRSVARFSQDVSIEEQAWLETLGVRSVGAFNQVCVRGSVPQLIRVAEGFQEKRISLIADEVQRELHRVQVICIAGPSSSGKSTFIRRLSVQLQVNGINPVGLGLDDYYMDRELTPKDESGDYDFEALEAIDLKLLSDHLARILAGESVKTARYHFAAGRSEAAGGPQIQLRPRDVLVLEGIHGLNPRLLGDVAAERVFRIFICPLAQLAFDHLSRVHASDARLVRRIVRDRHSRGFSAAETILRWPKVRAGERKHIFPHQTNADAVFDTSLIYELSVLRVYAERYLLEVPRDSPAFATAFRLLHELSRFVSIYPDHVPPTSILREFIGGSGFEY